MKTSVVITSYNYARFLPSCIDSVLAQTQRDLEIIVVDDGSTDNSRAVLDSYGERITALYQQNAGQAAALSRGVAAAHGELICFLDCDDGWEPTKVERVVAIMKRFPQVGWVRHKARMVDEQLSPLGQIAPRFEGSGMVSPDPVLFLERIVNCTPSCLAIRNEVARKVFPLLVERALQFDADDAVLLGRIFATGAIGYSIDEVLGWYRRHPGERFGAHDIPHLLRREADVTAALPRLFNRRNVPSAAYKTRAVLAALEGAPPWSARRLRPLASGIAAAARLYRHPRLMARQLAALGFGYAAPRLWLRKLAYTQQWPRV